MHKKEGGTNKMVLIRTNPYTRFVQRGHPPVLVQSGRFYSDGGQPVLAHEIPSWVKAEVDRMTPEGRQAVGLTEDWASQPNKKQHPTPPGEPTLMDVVQSLDPEQDDHWTKDGKPNLSMVSAQVGRYITRKEVDSKTDDYRRPDHGNG